MKCSESIPLSWLLHANGWTKYRCVSCGILHEFTSQRRIFIFICVAAFFLFFSVLEDILPSFSLRLLITAPTMLLILSIIPWQHRLAAAEEKTE